MSQDPFDRIHNGQILHYTRREPGTGRIVPYLNWRRSICPWNLALSRNDWEPIERPRYTNEDLLAVAERTPRLITGQE
jgi:hypothetical protein